MGGGGVGGGIGTPGPGPGGSIGFAAIAPIVPGALASQTDGARFSGLRIESRPASRPIVIVLGPGGPDDPQA